MSTPEEPLEGRPPRRLDQVDASSSDGDVDLGESDTLWYGQQPWRGQEQGPEAEGEEAVGPSPWAPENLGRHVARVTVFTESSDWVREIGRVMDVKQLPADAEAVRSSDQDEQRRVQPGSAFPRLIDREQAARRDALFDKLQRKREALKRKGA